MVSAPLLMAQKINLGDSLSYYFRMKPTPALRIDTRNSFVTGRNVRIYGLKAGFNFGNRIAVGLGYNWLANGQDRIYQPIDNGPSYDAELRFSFISPFIDYIFYQKKALAMSIPVQMGFGYSQLVYRDMEGNKVKAEKGFVVLYEPAMTVEHRFLRYFAAGAGVGFRLMLKNNSGLDERFSAPIYLLRLRVLFDELNKDFGSAAAN